MTPLSDKYSNSFSISLYSSMILDQSIPPSCKGYVHKRLLIWQKLEGLPFHTSVYMTNNNIAEMKLECGREIPIIVSQKAKHVPLSVKDMKLFLTIYFFMFSSRIPTFLQDTLTFLIFAPQPFQALVPCWMSS